MGQYLAIISMADPKGANAAGCAALCSTLAIFWRISIVHPVASPCSCIVGSWDAYSQSTLTGLFGRLYESPLTLWWPELSMLNLLRPTRSVFESRHPLYLM